VGDPAQPTEGPDLEVGQTWQPRGSQPPREVLGWVTFPDGEKAVLYRAGPEQAPTTVGNFRSWIREFDAKLKPA
jgi:hypothetical protein